MWDRKEMHCDGVGLDIRLLGWNITSHVLWVIDDLVNANNHSMFNIEERFQEPQAPVTHECMDFEWFPKAKGAGVSILLISAFSTAVQASF
jgi:hypothetical protein